MTLEPHELVLHGDRVSYRTAGSGPALLLLHGIANSSETWERVAPLLSERFTLIAPDLMGHGQSASPRGDYSLGAHASAARDIVTALGHEHVTVVGHSLGGGVAMQFAYQYPQRCERLVLVSSGGLGTDVSAILRAAALPGSQLVIPLIASSRVIGAGHAVARMARMVGIRLNANQVESARAYAALASAGSRSTFLHTLRGVVDHRGQRITAVDRLHLLGAVPTMLVWGDADRVIPIEHAVAAHDLIPGSRLEVFEGVGHFPHVANPARFAQAVASFIAATPR